MNLYVGNLEYFIKAEQLKELFEEMGTVTSVKIITDKVTGRSKGFAFVEMTSEAEAQNAINTLHGRAIKERAMTVNEARPKTEGSDRKRI